MNEIETAEQKELNITIAPNQLKQIQDILSKETGGKVHMKYKRDITCRVLYLFCNNIS